MSRDTVHNRRPKTVYFIRPVGMESPVKVGCSQSPEGRRGSLATWSPFSLEIIAEIDGDHWLERRFHAYFRDTYQRREWFGWSDRMAAVVAAINAGTFDKSILPEPTRIGRLHIKRKPWSEESKRSASYNSRLRSIRKKSRLIPMKVDGDKVWRFIRDGDEASLALIDEFLADPVAHGCTFEAKYPEVVAEMEQSRAAWLARQRRPESAAA